MSLKKSVACFAIINLFSPMGLGKFNSPMVGEDTKKLMRQKALGKKPSEGTKLKMSASLPIGGGNLVKLYEKCYLVAAGAGFKLIGILVSARRAAKFLDISLRAAASTVIKYIN